MPRSPRPGRRRRLGWAAGVPVVAIGAGLLFAASAQTAKGTDLRASGADLADVIRDQTRVVEQRQRTVTQLQEQIDALTAASAPGDTRIRALRAQAAELAPSAGTEAVTGPALTVTLDDAHRTADSLPPPFTADDIVVHQQDVQSVVNAMWAGGAEAMMLQDQRVISTSAVRCVGNTLILQGRVYSPPYRISAIGDVEGMRRALENDTQVGYYRQYVEVLGLGYEVTSEAEASFPAYAGSVELSHAKVGG